MKSIALCLVGLLLLLPFTGISQAKRPRDYGIRFGILPTGSLNAITDVKGIRVGHYTLVTADSIRTGATAILPHGDNVFQEKVPGAIYIGNGFGKLAGYSQVKELGTIETPIVLTNTLSVPAASEAVITYTLRQEGNESVRSVNAVVGETNDGYLNDIRGRHVTTDHVISAIENATGGPVVEGNVGAGTGTVCFGYKGGIGTSSRILPESMGGYTVGVLVQTNFGGVLEINGVPVGQELGTYPYRDQLLETSDGSCMIVVMTDAPVDARNLERMAKRAIMGLAKTGGIASNGSGDYVVACSVAEQNRIPHSSEARSLEYPVLRNEAMTPLFLATIEATEEAIINSLFAAEAMAGRDGHVIEALPTDRVLELMRTYGKVRD